MPASSASINLAPHAEAGPWDRYQQALAQGFQSDPAQAQVVRLLQQRFEQLSQPQQVRWWQRLSGHQANAVTGLYLWGGVGRGKTWMMDLFFHCLPGTAKKRFHFHQFMHALHGQLRQLGDVRDPLPQATRALIGEIRVLCFDEFFVSDIGDAMLLAGVLQTLVDQGITLVATSNVAPDLLYYDGLQRARFLPAIALLKQHTQIVEIANGDDFRLRTLDQMDTYLVPHNDAHEVQLASSFEQLCGGFSQNASDVEINDRPIPTLRLGEGVVWFDFSTLCTGHRAAADYVELARAYHTVILSDIPIMGQNDNDAGRRFIHLIDALYDHRVKLIASAAAAPQHLYQGQRLAAEFQRTSSRLIEMRSHDYLAEPHRP